MIETKVKRQPMRFFLMGCMLASGFMVALLLLHQGNFTVATALFAVSLAALVGTGKLASP